MFDLPASGAGRHPAQLKPLTIACGFQGTAKEHIGTTNFL
jgi:hypothetical protein